MSFLHKIFSIINNRDYRFLFFAGRGCYKAWPDDEYLKRIYKAITKEDLDLEEPHNFNQKMQWLKIHDRKDIYTQCADKYMVKELVGKSIGDEYIIPTLGVWSHAKDVDFQKLPDKFVLKTTHDSGGVIICRDKRNFDIKKARKFLSRRLKKNFFYFLREWPYKNIHPQIIAEEYISECDKLDVNDYKVFLFGGVPYCIQVDYDRFTDHHRLFFDQYWNNLQFTTCYAIGNSNRVKKPECLNELLELSKKLSKILGNPPFIRTDFYIVGKRIYFGELTFYHGSGTEEFFPSEYNSILGDKIDLTIANRDRIHEKNS